MNRRAGRLALITTLKVLWSFIQQMGGGNWERFNVNVLGHTLYKVYFSGSLIGYGLLSSTFGNEFDPLLTDPSIQVKLVKTVDGGKTWQVIPFPPGVKPLYFSFSEDQSGYVISDKRRLFKTEDGGVAWSEITLPQLPDPYAHGKTYTTSISDVVDAASKCYLSSSDGIFVSSDRGNSWLHMNSGSNTLPRTSLQIAGVFADLIVLYSDMSVFYSRDNGRSWKIRRHNEGNFRLKKLASADKNHYTGIMSGLNTENGKTKLIKIDL